MVLTIALVKLLKVIDSEGHPCLQMLDQSVSDDQKQTL
jgi:hypothetical protein